ncbi:ABC transporter permease [Confluentibacter sediminis]|uniref:ABC transporter permease n=1 Tax=Confluentibacter sediminis TaxID=2219045 RepID=UPI000DADC124|nr:ABC transporter permease [Confluentibacter sediminis]
MIKNYFKIAWRNLLKNKAYSFINIGGLAVGIACFILIARYVVDELSYDRWNPYAENIYRINSNIRFGGSENIIADTSDPMGETMKEDYPQVLQFTRFYNSNGPKLVKVHNEFIRETSVVHADSTLLDIFPFEIIAGEKLKPLHGRDKVLITETAAKKYFGSMPYDQIIGKTLEVNGDTKYYTVTAIMKDVPQNTHFHFNLFFTMANVNYDWNNFLNHNFLTYIKLKDGTDPTDIEAKFKEFSNKYLLPQAKAAVQINSLEEFEQAGNYIRYSLISLEDIHLYSNRSGELEPNGNIQYVYIFSVIALFVLLIACINFMNLATARSTTRAKEVGVRKVLGTDKKLLISQFLSESIIMCALATIFGVSLAIVLLNPFNTLSAKTFHVQDLFSLGWIVFYLLLPIVVGVLSGLYPAFYLSSFKPITVLKGKMQISWNKDRFRSSLVVFQFVISIVLIVGSFVVFNQLEYIQNKNVGFNKEQILVINDTGILGNNQEAFKNEITNMSGVSEATYAGYIPVSGSARSNTTFFKESTINVNSGINMQDWRIDESYIPLMGMEMVEGRNFSKEMKTDSMALILNEEAVKLLGFEDPIGKKLYGGGRLEEGIVETYHVIGVVKDFNYESLRENVGPLALKYGRANWAMAFKVTASNLPSLMTTIESKWKQMSGSASFTYNFMVDSFNDMYKAEQQVGNIAFTFSILAILIACLGLFGLASYMAEQRKKELGVRKVLGADVTNLITLLSKDFIKLVIIAFLIASPLAWYTMHRWLENFAYKASLSWWIFVVAGFIAILIALVTVSFQAIKAAIANPVKSLRTE